MRLAAAALLLCLAATPAWACQGYAGAVYVRTGNAAFAMFSRPDPILVNQPFTLDLQFCPDVPEKVVVDAQMPAHRHGMNYRPMVTKVARGDFRIDGLLFHMPGEWEFVFDLTYADGRRERLTHTVTVQ